MAPSRPRVALLTFGTTGDVRPFLAFALRLRCDGCDPVLMAPENFADFVARRGIAYRRLSGDTKEQLDTPDGRRWLAAAGTIRLLRVQARLAHERRHLLQRDLLAACAGSDLIVAHPLLLAFAAAVAERMAVPCVMAAPIPAAPATRAFPQFLVSTRPKLPPALNLLSHRLFALSYERAQAADLAEWRAALGLGPLRRGALAAVGTAALPALHAYSPTLVPKPADWGAHNVITGAWRLEDVVPADGEVPPPPGLAAWLSEGEAPLYIGFGSMPATDPRALRDVILGAVAALGARAVVARGWSGLGLRDGRLSHAVFVVDQVDHQWLFPRCRLIVHHGGAGTTHAALGAGRPAVVCSRLGDQPFWGERIAALGAGVHLPRRRFGARALRGAIEAALHPNVTRRARDAAERMRAERGLDAALRAIRPLLDRARPKT